LKLKPKKAIRMLHAQIAQRAFNTPLLVEPAKAMAFLSGLGPRVLGRHVEMAETPDPQDWSNSAVLPAHAGILTNGLAENSRHDGLSPFVIIDGIAVIEISGVLIHRGAWIGKSSGQTSYEGIAAQIGAATSDPTVRGVALDIDSFGGEVAGVFDLADRIRALRTIKPVWAFVAEHAFSAGYALASQADRILLPRTGAVGSIGVVVMHADLSGQLDQDGVRVTLIHAGSHKVDANPYAPLPDAVRDDIQREIDVLRFLFAETVAAGRAGRLSQEAALATEAASFRGADAVAAGLADEVIDMQRGFAAFQQRVANNPTLSPARAGRVAAPQPRKSTQPKEEARMATGTDNPTRNTDSNTETDQEDTLLEDAADEAAIPQDGHSNAADDEPAIPAKPPAGPVAPVSAAAQPGNLAELSAQLRNEAADITEIAAQAGRLGIAIDAAKALRDGTTPEALRSLVLQRAAAAADARDIVAAPPSPVMPQTAESPIVAAAKRAASAGAKR
jgi:signal peptide peptidase SppA